MVRVVEYLLMRVKRMNRHYIESLTAQYRCSIITFVSGFLRVCACYYREMGLDRSDPSVYQGVQGTFSPLLGGGGGLAHFFSPYNNRI